MLLYFLIMCISAAIGNGNKVNRNINWPDYGLNRAFIFTYSDNRPWKDLTDYSTADEQIFGKEIAQQLCLIDHTYVIFSKSNDSRPVIIKPTIYSSINKLKQHYKTILKKALMEKETAMAEFGNILIKGYVCYSEETSEVELLLTKTKSAEEIKNVFDQIIIKKLSE
jgi:hypothetical protein